MKKSGRKPLNLAGQKFGQLTAIDMTGSSTYAGKLWNCICECGKKTTAYARQLKSGHKKSCGCRKVTVGRTNGKKRLVHGRTIRVNGEKIKDKTYNVWSAMRVRCNKKDSVMYKYYGLRGIKICKEWADFEVFLKDMGEAPEGRSIDRIDNNGNYEPSNCRWATAKEQARNRSNNYWVEYDGRKMCLSELSELVGISRSTLRWEITKAERGATV